MSTETFDLVVIGAGSAARDGAARARREHGARVAMIERERWGGSCPNVACRPTKAYLVAAELAHDVDNLAERLGVEVGPARVDLAVPELRLAIEHDGRAVHEQPGVFRDDRRRQNALVAAGWTVLRFTAADLRWGAAPAVAQVLALVRAAAA